MNYALVLKPELQLSDRSLNISFDVSNFSSQRTRQQRGVGPVCCSAGQRSELL